MARILYPTEQKDDTFFPPPLPSFPSLPVAQRSPDFEKETTPSPPSVGRITPSILLVVAILAVIFFISGLLHLLVRFLTKIPSFPSISQSNRYPETSGSRSLQRQLQQLFRLHDSGLDQSLIDTLPLFYYKDITGLKEPFDCAVCLCEFSDRDILRLIPVCSHAFHINCIDTWLLSNSTCPLCRGTLVISPGLLPIENPLFNIDEQQLSGGDHRPVAVRIGKYRRLNGEEEEEEEEEGGQGESSGCKLDERRCYSSMGSFQYVVGDSDLQVDLSVVRARGVHGNSSFNGDVEGKRISGRSRGESFSVSKIWLWSKKGIHPNSSDTCLGVGNASSLR